MDHAGSSLSSYYLAELARLEDDSAAFAQEYPNIAGQLGLGREGPTDPHVRQLIESVAFIAARLKAQIDQAPVQLAHGIVHTLAPELIGAIPSMAIARFTPKSARLEPVGAKLPASLRLRASGAGGDCLFTAGAADVSLWPLALSAGPGQDPAYSAILRKAGIEARHSFVIRLDHAHKDLPSGMPGELSFLVSGALTRALAAMDVIALQVRQVHMVALDGSWSRALPPGSIAGLGFRPEHRLLPFAEPAQGVGLVSEFMHFARRFCFFQARNLACPVPARGFLLVLELDEKSLPTLVSVGPSLQLNCVPIVNLYPRGPTTLLLREPFEEHLIARPDPAPGAWDVFAVNRVRLVHGAQERVVEEFHGATGAFLPHGDAVTWQGFRRERQRTSNGHASLRIRFANLAQERAFDMALLDLTCCNCDAPRLLPVGAALEVQGWDGAYGATLETVPSAYVPPLLAGDDANVNLLKLLQHRGGGAVSMTQRVRQYLSACHRAPLSGARELGLDVQEVRRELVALPWPDMPLGAGMGMGCQYVVRYGRQTQGVEGRYLFARVLRRVLMQLHDMPVPAEVCMLGGDGEMIHVD
ncbi:type VI secretion system baseplate subunit TssF [Variovorax saccharolyticus]|uniref:type VI secretion system baseplate subunit TssF n=1 Tax=Variovorax saccharolyticus TaxID=3053516 RepID=UPI002574D2D6|nr:type VI secretion system baseplate subunit TssF [Variovorax sp. J31P216]MDM0029796.1 type VI secretion system baseplate subunit TssF [Variovorax sp. J31P216]